MSNLKVGDWVTFWTKNWPPGVVSFRLSGDDNSPGRDITGEGLYSGRGKIIRAGPEGWTVQEQRGDLLVEVDAGERIELMDRFNETPMTLGDLRRFMEEHQDAPDNTPILVSLPVGFNCDEDFTSLPEDHPDVHTPDVFHSVSVSHFSFDSVEEMADLAGQFEDAGAGMHAGPQIEIFLLVGEAHEVLRDCKDDDE